MTERTVCTEAGKQIGNRVGERFVTTSGDIQTGIVYGRQSRMKKYNFNVMWDPLPVLKHTSGSRHHRVQPKD